MLLQIQHENNFLPTNEHRQAKGCRSLGIFFCTTASFIAQISSSENVSKQDATLAPVAKQWIAEDIPSYETQSKRVKIAIQWVGKY